MSVREKWLSMQKILKLLLILSLLLAGVPLMAQQSSTEPDVSTREDTLTTELPPTIVYLITEESQGDAVDNAAAISERFEAVTLHEWDDYLQFERLFLVEALILHPSALEFVDDKVITAAYERGVVISVLNIPNKRLVELLDNPLLEDRYTLVENDVVFALFFSFDASYRSTGGSTVGRFGDANEAKAFAISLFDDIENSRQARLDVFDLNGDD